MNPEDAHLHYPMVKDVDWIRHQYLDCEIEMSEICDMIGCPRPILDWWLDQYGIEVREGVEYRELYDAGWLRQKFDEEGMNIEELSREIGCSRRRLATRLRELEILGPEDQRTSVARSNFPELYDREWLERKYIDEGMTAREISAAVGCEHGTVRDHLSAYEIRKRDQDPQPPQLADKSWLEEKFLEKGLSDREISQLLEVSPYRVRSARKRFDIRRETKYPKLRDAEWLREKWESELLTPNEIGELAGGASSSTVRDWLYKHDIF